MMKTILEKTILEKTAQPDCSPPPRLLPELWARACATFAGPGLYVVGTPIGNRADISVRALCVLSLVDGVVCEDTRHTRALLSAYHLRKPLVAHHAHNEARSLDPLMARLLEGQALALVSDAGMPAISDPGTRLVARARQVGIPVYCIPGPSAVTAAVSMSGLAAEPFVFGGFIPAAKQARRTQLQEWNAQNSAIVALETPHRLRACLRDMAEVMPARHLAVTRELTKVFEEVTIGTATQLLERYQESPVKGEITLVLEATTATPAVIHDAQIDVALNAVSPDLSMRLATKQVAQELAIPRRRVYQRALQLGGAGKDDGKGAGKGAGEIND